MFKNKYSPSIRREKLSRSALRRLFRVMIRPNTLKTVITVASLIVKLISFLRELLSNS